MDVVDSKLAHVSVENGGEENSSVKENGKINQAAGLHEPIKFGSHGVDEPVKGEVNKVSEANFPKDAVDEWPAPKQVHSFYFVKYRSFEDQKIKAKLEQADKELQKKNQMRSQLIDKLRAKKSERAQVISHLKAHGEENKQYWMKIDEKKKEMEPLQQALGQLRGANYGGRGDRRSGLCSSEEELNDVIKSLQYRIQHESIPLTEEKQILREIKQLEGTREKVIANAAVRAKIQESMGEKEALQDQVKLIGGDMDGVRKEQQMVKAKLKQFEEEKEAIDKEIKSLEEELTALTQKRDQTFESIHQLRKQREEGNSSFYENRSLLIKAKEFAAKKDVEALKDLSETEVNKFITVWSSNKVFREDYERRIMPSLDMRQLSRDGRMRNPDEKPLLAVVSSTPVEAEVVPRTNVKQEKNVKQAKVDLSPPSEPDASSVQKGQKEKKKEATDKKAGTAVKSRDVEDEPEFYVPEKSKKDPPKSGKFDELKMKEMKREEEIAKAKLAMERKKKLAEKAAAKAELRKQKEAEKKEKEREKKLKKKAGGASATAAPPESEEQTEAAVAEVAESEKVEEVVETQAPAKNKERKENGIRYRKRSKGTDSLPRTLLKRKKATNYWMWAAPAAALAVALLFIVGYKYLL